jgi:hypothetical protein
MLAAGFSFSSVDRDDNWIVSEHVMTELAGFAGESGEQAIAFDGEILVRHAAFGIARKFWFQPIEEERHQDIGQGREGADCNSRLVLVRQRTMLRARR